jgi:protoheme IX farnesyltransferase
MSGTLYLIGALILGAGFVYRALRLLISTDESQAMRTFNYSIVYLTLLFSSLLVDHYLADAIAIL